MWWLVVVPVTELSQRLAAVGDITDLVACPCFCLQKPSLYLNYRVVMGRNPDWSEAGSNVQELLCCSQSALPHAGVLANGGFIQSHFTFSTPWLVKSETFGCDERFPQAELKCCQRVLQCCSFSEKSASSTFELACWYINLWECKMCACRLTVSA